jgi:hypothetical protein
MKSCVNGNGYFIVHWKYIFWGQMPLFLFFNTQTMHIKSIVHNTIALTSFKTLHPGRIRTRVFCSWGGCNVDCATQPGQYVYSTYLHSEWNWEKKYAGTKRDRSVCYASALKQFFSVIVFCSGGARFFLVRYTKKENNIKRPQITQWPKIYQIAVKYSKWP